MTGLPLPRLREKKQEHLLEKKHCINNHKLSKACPHGLLQKNNNKFLSLCTTLLLEVLILWDSAILHFLCLNTATPRACITKPVYNKMVFFALVIINALYYWAAHEGNIQSRNESRLCQKKKKKMVDRAARSLCISHSRFNVADFCREGTGHFRSCGEQIWKSV